MNADQYPIFHSDYYITIAWENGNNKFLCLYGIHHFMELSLLQIKVVVSDVNDNFPQFKEVSYSVKVMETDTTQEQMRNDALVVSIGHVSATDADDGRNATINYTIISGNPGKFTVATIRTIT